MAQKRKHYSKQFKIDAVKLITEQGNKVSEAARNLGLHHSSLRRWKNQLDIGTPDDLEKAIFCVNHPPDRSQ